MYNDTVVSSSKINIHTKMLSTLERENSDRETNATFKITITRRRTKRVENECLSRLIMLFLFCKVQHCEVECISCRWPGDWLWYYFFSFWSYYCNTRKATIKMQLFRKFLMTLPFILFSSTRAFLSWGPSKIYQEVFSSFKNCAKPYYIYLYQIW